MNEHRKSDGPAVPLKSPNKAGHPAAEEMEGGGPAKGNPPQQNAPRTQSRPGALSALERVRLAAARDRGVSIGRSSVCHIGGVTPFGRSSRKAHPSQAPHHGSVLLIQHALSSRNRMATLRRRPQRRAYWLTLG
jgi:hypothetical protein